MTDLSLHNEDLRLSAAVRGPAEAPNVLCLHGISNSRDTWEETVDHLSDRYRVWTLDFRGHGYSDRAKRYLIQDYSSDAQAMLKLINQPTVIVGHSLGGMVAAFLAQQGHPLVKAVFLEDPPIYLGEQAEWDKTLLSKTFPVLRKHQIALQEGNTDFFGFVEFAAQSESILGGVVADHQTQRHLDSNGGALQRHDPNTWQPALDLSMLEVVDSSKPLLVPCRLLQADHNLGPAFLKGHEARFAATNPDAEIELYAGAPHRIHATQKFESRFISDVETFITQNASM